MNNRLSLTTEEMRNKGMTIPNGKQSGNRVSQIPVTYGLSPGDKDPIHIRTKQNKTTMGNNAQEIT